MVMNVIQNRGTAVEQEAVTETGSARGEASHIICLVTLLLGEILTMNNFHHQDLCMPNATHADAVHDWSLARSSTIPMMSGTRTAGRLHNTVGSPVRALHPRIAPDLFLGTTRILISDTPKATSLLRRSAILRTTSNPRSLLAVAVLRLTKTHPMHRLDNLVSGRHLFLPLLLSLRRRSHINHHQSHQMAEDLRSLGLHHHLP